MGRPADTEALSHCMSTSSLVLTIMNGPSLDIRAFLPPEQKFSTMITSPVVPLSKNLFVTSLVSYSARVSLSFRSRTISERRSLCSGYGLHRCTCFELPGSPRCCRQRLGLDQYRTGKFLCHSSVCDSPSVLLKRSLVSISDTAVW